MTQTTTGFIGAGNIAEAMIRGIITSGELDPGQIVISDCNQERLNFINQTLGPRIAESNPENASRVNILFLTVKPGKLFDVLDEIKGHLQHEPFLVSVAAGKSLDSIRAHLGGYSKLLRIMPNLATGVRKGTIGLYAEKNMPPSSLDPVFSLLSSTGRVFSIDNESLMAPITALSGSAPAYYVMMADALVTYGISQGLSKELASEMILSAMEGSAAWARGARTSLNELWQKVVTQGGTTEAGIRYYRDKHFIDIFIEGLGRATDKARKMGDR